MSFFTRLCEFRQRAETLGAFAKRCGVARNQMRLWSLQEEAGKPAEPRRETIDKIAVTLGLSTEYLRSGLGPSSRDESERWIEGAINGVDKPEAEEPQCQK